MMSFEILRGVFQFRLYFAQETANALNATYFSIEQVYIKML